MSRKCATIHANMRNIQPKNCLKLPEAVIVSWNHWLYCRKCETPEGIIALSEKTKQQCDWERVCSIGMDVGNPRFKARKKLTAAQRKHLKHHGIPRRVLGNIELGDVLLIPDLSEFGIKHSPYDKDEFFLEEYVMLCKWLGGDDYLPLGNRILVEPEVFDKDANGIELPDQAEGLPSRAVVVKLGTGIADYSNNPVPFEVKVGDTVLLPFEQFKEIQCDSGKRYQIVEVEKIEAVL